MYRKSNGLGDKADVCGANSEEKRVGERLVQGQQEFQMRTDRCLMSGIAVQSRILKKVIGIRPSF